MQDILQTKLNRPVSGHNFVSRLRLLKLLDASRTVPLTVVSAPAGYGKSRLVGDWLEQRTIPYGWLALDEEDNHLFQFTRYLIATLHMQNPQIGANVLAMLRAPIVPTDKVLIRTLINDLNSIEQDCWLVLDDYHVIHNEAVQHALTTLLHHAPPKLHLIVITRAEPSLPLATLRARGQLVEIGIEKLRFSPQETADLLKAFLGYALDEDTVVRIHRQTEGWAVGLRLLSYSLSQKIDLPSTLTEDSFDLRHFTDYFSVEVFAQVAERTRTFLMATSLLDTVCPALAHALLPDQDGDCAAILARLWQNNLFVTPIDDQGEWYRYHDLFRVFLRQQATEQFAPFEIERLHRTAARWYQDQGSLDKALHHALRLTDPSDAVQFVIHYRHNLLDREQWTLLERWLDCLPKEQIQRQPELLVTQALIANNRGRLQTVDRLLKQAEILLITRPETPETTALRGEIDLLRGSLVGWSGDGSSMVHLSQRALDRLPEDRRFVRTGAATVLAAGWRFMGRQQIANDYLYRLYEYESTQGYISQATLLLFVMCIFMWNDNDLTLLQIRAQALLTLGHQHQRPESVAIAHYFLGCAAFQQDDLSGAVEHLEQAIANPYLLQTFYYAQGVCALAHAYQRLGRPGDALSAIDAAAQIMLEMQVGELPLLLDACRIEISLWRGVQAGAEHWVQQISPSLQPLYRGFYDPTYTRLKILLLRGTPADLEQAETVLAGFQQVLTDLPYRRHQLQVRLYKAWLANQRDDRADALSALREALRLAEPDDSVRVFADLVPVLSDLLQDLHHQDIAADFISVIFAASADTPLPPLVYSSRASLSEREQEVLTLLARGLSNDEISRHLFIALGTVKQHTHRIYRKLGVNNRDQAVRLARSLKLLP